MFYNLVKSCSDFLLNLIAFGKAKKSPTDIALLGNFWHFIYSELKFYKTSFFENWQQKHLQIQV